MEKKSYFDLTTEEQEELKKKIIIESEKRGEALRARCAAEREQARLKKLQSSSSSNI
jgi:hypothetical protein